MKMILSNSSKQPLYEQVTSQIKKMIQSGELQEGEMLPSMRKLAKSCQISVMTAQRAYEDLQREGWVETVAGKGSFVAIPNQMPKESPLPEWEVRLKEIAFEANKQQIPLQTIIEKITQYYEESKL